MITHDLSGYLPKIEHYLIVDLETTDKLPGSAQILTGFFILVDKNLKVIDTYDLKAAPRLWDKAAQDSTLIHGITYDVAKTFPSHILAMKNLSHWLLKLPTCHFVAHANRTIFGRFSTFDYAVLNFNLFDYGYQFIFYNRCPVKSIISTHSLAKYLSLGCNLDLKSLSDYFKLPAFSHHDAEADAKKCLEIFKRLMSTGVDVEAFLNQENYNIGVENDGEKKKRDTRPLKGQGLRL